jgi:hypothetical protein
MLGLLSHLADLTGVAYDGEHAKMVLNRLSLGKTEPLERLQILAAECCMSLHPMRVSVSSALWMARNEQPLVAWCEGKQDWLVIQRHGIFRAHL